MYINDKNELLVFNILMTKRFPISVITLLIGFILGFILLIVYIPVVLIEMSCCCCLGTVMETAVKAGFETS